MRKVKGTEIRGTTYHYCFSHQGQRIRGSIGTCDPVTAERKVAEKRAALFSQKEDGECIETWADAVEIFAEWKSTNKDWQTYERHLVWLTGVIGAKTKLADIDIDTITKITRVSKKVIVLKKGEPRSHATTNRYLATLRCLLNLASRKIKNYQSKTIPEIEMLPLVETERKWLSEEDADRLIEELSGSCATHIYEMARFALETGLRQSNVKLLKWEWVTLNGENSEVRVPSTSTKSGKWITIPLSDGAVAVLEERHAALVNRRNTKPGPGLDETYVFTNKAGQIVNRPYAPEGAFQGACKRLGMEWVRWHDLRHAFATRHLQKGTPIHILQQLGGWSDIKIVLDTYAHIAPSDLSDYRNNARRGQALQPKARLVAIK